MPQEEHNPLRHVAHKPPPIQSVSYCAGHTAHMDNPAGFNKTLLGFFEANLS